MRKVKFSYKDKLYSLTNGKVYDVVELRDDYFKIINDVGLEYAIMISNNLFIDVTSEYRNELIDEILT